MNLFRTLALASVAAASAIGSNADRSPEAAASRQVTTVAAERAPANPTPYGAGCVATLLPCRTESEPSVSLRWPVIGTR